MRAFLISLAAAFMFAADAANAASEASDVRVRNGEIELAATIVWPASDGPHPGLVLVPGSGSGERSELAEVARGLAAAGLAVMVYDKRGSGESSGSWITSSLSDLAGDAAAAFGYLVEQPQVDEHRSGLWGISQGGWVVPLAAERISAAFGIVVTGGGLAPAEVERAAYLKAVRGIEDTPSTLRLADQVIDAYFDYLSGTLSRPSLMQTIEPHRQSAWFDAMNLERVIPGPDNRANWAWVATFQPQASIEALEIPVLVLLGADDPLLPTEATARAWREGLARDETGSRVQVLPDAGHGLRTGGHGGEFIDGYFAMQTEWLREAGILTSEVADDPGATASDESAGTLTVNAGPLESSEGQVRFTLFASKDDFLKSPQRAGTADIVDGRATWIVEGLPYGNYAVLVHHDLNANGKMERHWYGKPKEPTGASNNPRARMGPPRFQDTQFRFEEPELAIDIAVQ